MKESVTEVRYKVSIDLTRLLMQHAREHGVPVDDLLARHALHLTPLPDQPAFIDGEEFERLLAAGLRSLADPLPGLVAARWQVTSMFGLAGFLVQTASTVGALLNVIPQIEPLLGDMGVARVLYEPGEAHLVWENHFTDSYVSHHAADFILSAQSWGIQTLTDSTDSVLTAVHFRHDAPSDPALARRYLEAFGCPVYFGQPDNRLVMPVALLDRPLVSADPAVHEMLAQHARKLIEERRKSVTFVDMCRSTLHQLLHDGSASRDALAEMLGTSSRTLHRKLAEHGTSYRELFDDLRLERARTLLRDEQMGISEVAVAAGFDEPTSFVRWFRQMTGLSPAQYREQRSNRRSRV